MTDLPLKSLLTASDTTEAEFQSAISDLYDHIDQGFIAGAYEINVLSGDTINPTKGLVQVDTENDATTDNLKNITTATVGERLLLLRSVINSRVVTIKHLAGGSGQIYLNNLADLILDDIRKVIVFKYNPTLTRWEELWKNWGVFAPTVADQSALISSLGLGTSSTRNTGLLSGQIPLNSDLGSLAYVDLIDNLGLIEDGLITGVKIANASLALSKLANDTAGAIPVFNASGVASKITPVSAGRYLRDNGPGNVPSFETVDAGGGGGGGGGITYLGEVSVVSGSLTINWAAGAYNTVLIDVSLVQGPGTPSQLSVFHNGSIFGQPLYFSNHYAAEPDCGLSLRLSNLKAHGPVIVGGVGSSTFNSGLPVFVGAKIGSSLTVTGIRFHPSSGSLSGGKMRAWGIA